MQVYEDVLKELYKILRLFVPQGLEIGEEMDMVADLGLDSVEGNENCGIRRRQF